MARRDTSAAYRYLLVLLASVLVALCAYLSLVLRAVPTRDQWAVLLAVLYGVAFSILVPAPVQSTTPTQATNDSASSSVSQDRVRPLAAPGSMRTQAVVLLCISAFLSVALPVVWLALSPPRRHEVLLAPHLFVMSAQVVFELLTYRPGMNLLIRLAVPVLATAYRLRLLAEWVTASERILDRAGEDATVGDTLMRVLSVANLMFWVAVLFIFLLLKVVPRYFANPKTDPPAPELDMDGDSGDRIFPSPVVSTPTAECVAKRN